MSPARPRWSDVWWVDFGLAGRRPGLVLTRPEAIGRTDHLLVAPASTVVRGLTTEVSVGPDDGLPKVGVFQLDSLRLLRPYRLEDYITDFPAGRWHEVCDAMAAAINC